MQLKFNCGGCPPDPNTPPPRTFKDWEMHPSWIAGIEALNSYNHWVSSIVMPIAFQWIEEHKPEVYATIPDELKDDVGVVFAAAFKLIKNLPAYRRGVDNIADCEAAVARGETSTLNPVWTRIVQKIRTDTEAAFAQQPSLSVE